VIDLLGENPAATASWVEIDDHGTHALVLDDFLAEPDPVRAFARNLAFQPPASPDNYPGVKAYVSLAGAARLKQTIAERFLARLFPLGRSPALRTDQYDAHGAFCAFACDRAAPPVGLEDLHTDGFAWLAAVLHLAPEVEGRGTAMWEHRPSGLQQWLATDPVRLASIERVLGLRLTTQLAHATTRVPLFSNADAAQLFRTPTTRRPFTTDEDATWRLRAYVPARWNRLVVYPTWQIHSVVDTSPCERPTFDDARLTFNMMIEYPFARELTRSRPPYPAGFYRSVAGLPGA
jgi:hypothetical protein